MKPIDDIQLGSVVLCRPVDNHDEEPSMMDMMRGMTSTTFYGIVIGYDLPYLMVHRKGDSNPKLVSTHDYIMSVLEGHMARACIGNAVVTVDWGKEEPAVSNVGWHVINGDDHHL